MLLSAKLAPTFDFPVLQEFWRNADELGFHSVSNYDHFYGLSDFTTPTYEGWTSLAAMASVVRTARVGCMVSSVTYRNPAMLVKMAVTVDHFEGRFYTIHEAVAEPKPLQRPHPPVVVGGEAENASCRSPSRRRVERAQARRRDGLGRGQRPPGRGLPGDRAGPGRDPALRAVVSAPAKDGQMDEQLASLSELETLGCAHAVLSFYQPPTAQQLRRCAELASDRKRRRV